VVEGKQRSSQASCDRPLHHGTRVVASDFHPVSDSGVSEAMASEAVCLAVIELGDLAGLATGPPLLRYRK